MRVAGDKVVLRRLAVGDAQAFQSYRADPDVARYQGWSAMSDAEALGFLREMSNAPLPTIGGWCQIGIADAATDTLIGDVGLHVALDHSAAELGITLSAQAQGKSQGYEAVNLIVDWIFAYTDVPKIVAITDQRNTGAQALLKRLGWPYVETLGPEVEIEGLTEFVFEYARPMKVN